MQLEEWQGIEIALVTQLYLIRIIDIQPRSDREILLLISRIACGGILSKAGKASVDTGVQAFHLVWGYSCDRKCFV